MAKKKDPPIFPAETVQTPEPEKPKEGPTVFPDMKNLSRNTAAPEPEEQEAREAAAASGKRAVCVRKCLYMGELCKPGKVKYFTGEIPPHFRAEPEE